MILPALRQRWLTCPNQLFISFRPPHRNTHSLSLSSIRQPQPMRWAPKHLKIICMTIFFMLPNVYSLHDLGGFRLFLSSAIWRKTPLPFFLFHSRVQLYPHVHCQQYGFSFPFHVCIPHIRVPMGPMTFHFLCCRLPIPFIHVSYLRSSYFLIALY